MPPQTVDALETLLREINVSRDAQRVRLSLQLTSEMLPRLSSPPPGKAAPASPPAR